MHVYMNTFGYHSSARINNLDCMNSDGTAAPVGTPSSSAVPGREPSLHQLRLFLVIAEELHFGRAAQRLFLTQPALSQQIRSLEQRLGIPLLERGTRSVELTPAGQALIPAAKAVVESMKRLQHLADLQHRQVSGNLVLGLIGGEGTQPYTHEMLAILRDRHPGITVELRNLDFARQFDDVADGTVDAAVIEQPVPPGLQTLDLSTHLRVVLLPSDDPLARDDGPPVTLSDLNDYTYLDMPPGTSHEWWDRWCINPRPDGTRLRYGPVVHDIEAVMLAVARGQGIIFLPASSRSIYPRPGITYVDVADLPPSTSTLAWAPASRSRPAVAALREAARTVTGRSQE